MILLWCFAHVWRVRRAIPDRAYFKHIDMTSLIKADLKRNHGFRCAIRGLINYRFARTLALRGLPIRRVIDWFENHPMDRGWNYGFNQYFPDADRWGYTGFFPAGQSYRPTQQESAANILPAKHLVIGEGFVADLCEFNKKLEVETAPAFRYQNLPSLKPSRSRHRSCAGGNAVLPGDVPASTRCS